MTLALAGISMPNFWLGPLLAILFAVQLGWLPVSGTGTCAHLVLPAVTLGAALAAILARMTRASLLEELRELYVLAARARGLSRARAVVRHAFRNSLIPVVTIIGLQFGAVLTGTIITETIFAWPGVGRLLIQAINFRDYPLVQGCILFISVTYVAMNLLTDLTYGLLDPRIRYRMMRPRRPRVIVLARPCCAAVVRAAALSPVRSDRRRTWRGGSSGPSARASARPRRARPRHPRAPAVGRADLAARRPRGRVGVVDRRHARRLDCRLLRRRRSTT